MHAPINLSKKSLDKLLYLVVEGPIGAGKTSLARRLAARLSADLLLEQPQAKPAVLVERVRRRAAGYERGISEEYLALLAESYARFFYHYDAAPLLIVNSENLNFVERDDDFELLVTRQRSMKSRREFFNLG